MSPPRPGSDESTRCCCDTKKARKTSSSRRGMEEASLRLREILARAAGEAPASGDGKGGVSSEALLALPGAAKLRRRATPWCSWPLLPLVGVLCGVLSVTLAAAFCLDLHTHAGLARAWLTWRGHDLYDSQCAVESPDWLQRAFRPPEDCALCRGLQSVERLAAVSPDIFEERFAYTGRPVVVTDAMRNWTAPQVFSFEFFKSVYEQSPQPGCQFFPYETEFRRLHDVFNMSQARAALQGPPWYVGWSNCDDRVARILRQHYGRPYFLPHNAENKQLDWIFMGSPGYGAHMHVDSVGHSSWQAQLRGHKLWVLQPPPECLYQCRSLQVTVHPGEIIVLDTNRWYHQTLIVSDEMSITIGAEYD